MMRYPHGVRWAGLWDFPRHELHQVVSQQEFAEYCDNIKRLTGYHVVLHDQIAEFHHAVTRYRITLKVFEAHTVGRKTCAEYQTDWVSKQGLADLALNSSGRKIAKMR